MATGRREIVLAVKSGRGCTRSFRERNKWHLRGSIYRLIWISRTSDAFLRVVSFSSFSSLSLSLLVFLTFAIFIVLDASIHRLVPYARAVLCSRMMMMVAPTSLHSILNVSWWKSLLCCRFYLLPWINSFERLDSSLLYSASSRFHWLSAYPVEFRSLEMWNIVCDRHIR